MNLKLILKAEQTVDNEATGARVRKARREMMFMLQSELAHSMGISSAYLSRLEKGTATWTQELLDKAIEGLKG